LLRERIASWGLVPTLTVNGKEAVDRFNQAFGSGTPYRLILLDLQIPELDGFDVAKRIKDAPSGQDTRIILLSSMRSWEKKGKWQQRRGHYQPLKEPSTN
jgi:two-component system, sensor histidine kinase and response regulator